MKRVRIVTEPLESPKSRVSVRISNDMLSKIRQAMTKKGDSQRKRWLWVSEALETFAIALAQESKKDRDLYIREHSPITENGTAVPLSALGEAGAMLSKWVKYVEQNELGYDDTQTRIVHMAISMRLMKDGIWLM